MNPIRPLLMGMALLVAGTCALGAAATAEPAAAPAGTAEAAKAVAPPPLSPRFQQVRNRIDALFKHRSAPPPQFDPRSNPFRPPGPVGVSSRPPVAGADPTVPPKPEPAADQALLQQAVATLKVSGVAEVFGRQHLVINSRPYKEGDAIQTQVNGESVYLGVKTIAGRTVTLTLHTAEMTLKF